MGYSTNVYNEQSSYNTYLIKKPLYNIMMLYRDPTGGQIDFSTY